jgi:pimeloyl-ACP methyl ester carboxylesterase
MARREDRSLRYAAPAWARAGFRVLETTAPPVAVRLAVWKFCNPKRRPPRPEESRILATAERIEFRLGGQRIVAHEWGSGPRILFHHGWSGSGAQMAPVADALARAGYRVTVLDARAHGESPGNQATLPVMGRDLAEIGARLGDVHALVGHSMGAMIVARAMGQGLKAKRVAMLSAPAEIMPYARFFTRVFGLRDSTLQGMLARLGRKTGLSPAEARAEGLAEGRTEPLLILHDRDDADVPVRHPETWLAVWPGALLEFTEGLGHRRILRDQATAQRVVEFMSSGTN